MFHRECGRRSLINDNWLDAYGAHFTAPAERAGAIGWAKGFATGAHRFEVPDAAATVEVLSKPALAIWGMADRTLHAAQFLPLFNELFPRATVHKLDGVGHYSLEDAPETIAHHVKTFIEQS